MNTRARLLPLLLLSAATVISAGIAWQQHRSLRELRAATGASGSAAALEKRLADAEQRAHDLENELAVLRARASADTASADHEAPPSAPAVADPNAPAPVPRWQNIADGYLALTENTEFAKLALAQDKARLDGRFADLFKELTATGNLTPEQLETFKNLLVEKQNASRDAMLVARANGIKDRDEIRKLAKEAQSEVERQIEAQLGPAAYQQYKTYEQTAPQRNTVSQLARSLSYTSAPLNDAQSKQLVQILAETGAKKTSAATPPNTRSANFPGGGPAGGPTASVTDEAITRAQAVLSPAQLQALVTLQENQKAQVKMNEMARAARKAATAK